MLPRLSERNPRDLLIAICLALGLTMWFWLDLWLGGGLIGGDVYSYYLPQKAFYADSLKQGLWPFWNPLVGHGYPLVGESQTGVFYPPTWLLYRLLDLNTAYNLNHLFHYVLAFLATVALARDLNISLRGAILTGLIFVYGWFPPRCCWEWAIITGAYLPLNLWLLRRYYLRQEPLYLWGLATGTGLQLLAGHYNLAFITLLGLLAWGVYESLAPRAMGREGVPARFSLLPFFAILLGVGLASIQLFPTWELKRESQRETQGNTRIPAFDPAVGHLPPRSLSQVIAPWLWYGDMSVLNQKLNSPHRLSHPAETNPVEAHLYFSLTGLLLAGMGGWSLTRRASADEQRLRMHAAIGILAVVYATGWLLPITAHLPGFSYFRGPGRFTVLTALAVGLWAARGWDVLAGKLAPALRNGIWAVLFVAMVLEFSWVSQRVTYTYMVPETPVDHRKESVIGTMLGDQSPPARLFAPGANLPTLTGVAATPVYLGLGPQAYFDPLLTLPLGDTSVPFGAAPSLEQIAWLRRAGVTHILGFAPPAPDRPELRLIWSGYDPVLNPAWGRREPLYLSILSETRGRAAWQNLDGISSQAEGIRWQTYRPDLVELVVSTPRENVLILTDLLDPNWQLYVNGEPRNTLPIEGMFRGAELSPGQSFVQWRYEPWGIFIGLWLSVAGITIWLLWGTRSLFSSISPLLFTSR